MKITLWVPAKLQRFRQSSTAAGRLVRSWPRESAERPQNNGQQGGQDQNNTHGCRAAATHGLCLMLYDGALASPSNSPIRSIDRDRKKRPDGEPRRELRVPRKRTSAKAYRPCALRRIRNESSVPLLELLMGARVMIAPMTNYRPRSCYESDNVPWSKAVACRAVRTMIGQQLRERYEVPQ